MFEPNNTCVLTMQIHFDFFRLIKSKVLSLNRTNFPQLIRLRIRISTNTKTNKKVQRRNSRTIGFFYFLGIGNLTNSPSLY